MSRMVEPFLVHFSLHHSKSSIVLQFSSQNPPRAEARVQLYSRHVSSKLTVPPTSKLRLFGSGQKRSEFYKIHVGDGEVEVKSWYRIRRSFARSKAVYSAIDSHVRGSQNQNGLCELNGPPNRSLRAESRPEHFSRARGRSDASPKKIPDFRGFQLERILPMTLTLS